MKAENRLGDLCKSYALPFICCPKENIVFGDIDGENVIECDSFT